MAQRIDPKTWQLTGEPVEQEVDPKAGSWIEEVSTGRRVDSQTSRRDRAAVDRRQDISIVAHARRQLEAAIVEDRDRSSTPAVNGGRPLRKHEPEQHPAAAHHDVLTAIELVRDGRVADGADR